MWDYNGDGVVNSSDDDAYWDDIYFQEHRGNYGGSYFKSDRSVFTLLVPKFLKNESASSEKKYESNSNETSDVFSTILSILCFAGIIIGRIVLVILILTVGVLLAMVGGVFMFVFPPLGLMLMAPLFWMLGGR